MRRGRSIYVLGCFLSLSAVLILSAFERTEAGVISANAKSAVETDIVLIGSEIEGVYLARAAQKEGLSAIILDPRDQPGGQLIQGEMLYLDEPYASGGKSQLQGSIRTLFDDYKNGKIRKTGEFKHYFDSLVEGIPIESGIALTAVHAEKDPDPDTYEKTVRSVDYRTKDGKTKTIYAKYFVENTDFAALSSKLGLQRIPGIEAIFGGEKDYMAASMMMKFRNVDWDRFLNVVSDMSKQEIAQRYGGETAITDTFAWGFKKVAEKHASSNENVFLRGLNIVNQRDGEALINALLVFQADPSNDASINRSIALGRRETELILPLLRRELPGWEHAEINGYPNYLYIRDYDRYETEYVLQAADLMGGRMFWDNVSIAGYPIDLQGTKERKWGEMREVPREYGIPLRAFIPKGYSNVIFAGKNIGASAQAYGSARIQANTALAAEVIGILLPRIGPDQSLADIPQPQMSAFQDDVKTKYGISLTGPRGTNLIYQGEMAAHRR